jgi:hypothetical protein
MNRELHKLFMELDYKFDIEINDYFQLDKTQRNQLTQSLVNYFLPYLRSHEFAPFALRRTLTKIIDEAVYEEDYEKAEIYFRFLKEVKALTFF